MSESFNIGDRVRYRAEMVERGYLHPLKLELTGKILRLPQGKEKCYLVKWNDVADSENIIHGSWLESVPPSGRTFEEIIKDLGNNKIITDFYCRDQNFPYGDNRDKSCEFFCMDEDEHSYVGFEIFDDGKVRMEEIFTTAELAAISAACSEISANYQAEHGKESAR